MDRRNFIFKAGLAAASIPLLSSFITANESTPLLFQNLTLPKALKIEAKAFFLSEGLALGS